MKERMAETTKSNDGIKNTWRRAVGGAMASLIVATSGAGCVSPEVNKTPITETAPVPGNMASAETPFVQVTPFQPVATEVVPVEETIKIDVARAIYPPLSDVQKSFEKGEYNAGLETIKQWVSVWEEMGVFKEIEIENNTLSPVPLEGKAKIVCVDTRKQGELVGKLLCPPLDLVNGGLKAVPENGKWDETDNPLLITFEKTEELVTRGSGSELVYQFMDKYVNTLTRYFDPKTGQIVEGRTMVSDFEVVENEIVVEGATGVSPEFLLDGNLVINKEAGDKYYRDFVSSLAINKENKDYMVGLLGNYPDGAKLLNYLKNNDYTLPPGLNLPYSGRYPGLVKLGNNPIKESIKLDTLKIVVFGSKEWNSDLGGVKEYIASLKTYRSLGTTDPGDSMQYLGWAIDLKDSRLVIVAGSKEAAWVAKYPWTEGMTIGGADGNFDFDRDALLSSAELFQINRILRLYNPKKETYQVVGALTLLCGDQDTSGVCAQDITAFFGQGKTLFDPSN